MLLHMSGSMTIMSSWHLSHLSCYAYIACWFTDIALTSIGLSQLFSFSLSNPIWQWKACCHWSGYGCQDLTICPHQRVFLGIYVKLVHVRGLALLLLCQAQRGRYQQQDVLYAICHHCLSSESVFQWRWGQLTHWWGLNWGHCAQPRRSVYKVLGMIALLLMLICFWLQV
jgi:hypothetical protein